MNKTLKGFIQGIVLGFATIAAVGGGTVAVLLGIYDDMISAISNFRKQPKKSFLFLWPILLGMLIGIVALIIPIKYLLEKFPFVTLSLFVGLTIGGLTVFKNYTKGKFSLLNVIMLILGISLVVGIGVFSWFNAGASNLNAIDLRQIFILFVVGFLASAALVAPGISGTLFLLALGYFNEIIELAKRVVTFNSSNWWLDFAGAASFGIGLLIGFFVISKIIEFFLKKNRTATYFTILGGIIGSLFICFFNGDIKPAYAAIKSFPTVTFILSLVALVIGAVLSYFLLKVAGKKGYNELSEAENEN